MALSKKTHNSIKKIKRAHESPTIKLPLVNMTAIRYIILPKFILILLWAIAMDNFSLPN